LGVLKKLCYFRDFLHPYISSFNFQLTQNVVIVSCIIMRPNVQCLWVCGYGRAAYGDTLWPQTSKNSNIALKNIFWIRQISVLFSELKARNPRGNFSSFFQWLMCWTEHIFVTSKIILVKEFVITKTCIQATKFFSLLQTFSSLLNVHILPWNVCKKYSSK
jgi:hypothetical protein